MKAYAVLLVLLTLLAVPARADVLVNLDAGELTGTNSIEMQPDDTNSSPNGSLLLLIDIGSSTNSTIDTSITPGDFVAGTDTVLAAGGFNNNGGTNETLTSFTITSGNTGDYVALLWFPQITYNQYKSGTLTVAGDYFGAYTPEPLGSIPDGQEEGADAWILPSSGDTLTLDFYTSNSDGGGSQPPSAGVADLQVEAVPEPSTFALFGIGCLVLLWFARRRNAV